MDVLLNSEKQLVRLCNEADISNGLDDLLTQINTLFPELDFKHVLTRGGWHRLGGVVDSKYNRVAENIVHWAEQECSNDPEELVLKYMDVVYFATKLAGKTHYLTAVCGDRAEQYIQLELEELQEVLDRPLAEPEWFPESMEEFFDPLDYPRLEPEPIGKPRVIFRRITSIEELVHETVIESRHLSNILRFFEDWQSSSASTAAHFCNHWVLALREYIDRDGERQVNAKPVPSGVDTCVELPQGKQVSGPELANAIHHYDHIMGYPFSWYFMMLGTRSENFALADAVLRDQMGAYDYLAPRDLKVLRGWEANPFSV